MESIERVTVIYFSLFSTRIILIFLAFCHLHIVNPVCAMLDSGWLSGKLNRGTDKPQSGTRIEWSSSGSGRAHHSHPDFKWFSGNEQAWGVIDKCQEIAKQKGLMTLYSVFVTCIRKRV